MRTQQTLAGAALALLALCPGTLALPGPGVLEARAECKALKVQSGDSCFTIAQQRCSTKISLNDLYKFNPGLTEEKCKTIKVGDPLCCTAGTMPDMDPQGNSDGTCKILRVREGDDCYKFATERCQPGIELAQLYKFNNMTEANCKDLGIGKPLCCSKGTKPDMRPKKNADGSCFWVAVPPGQGCNALTGPYDLTEDELDKLNVGKTWGWQGCNALQANQRVCLSDGNPPLPEPVTDKPLQCGPQVLGTVAPTNGTKIADLNPCPLNACCSAHGFCGVTPEFCTDTSIRNTPGTRRNNTNGCISNCGLEIVKGNPPASFAKVGYFESWNVYTRPCLTMDVNDIPKLDGYTHIHFSFANLTEDFVPSISGVQDQWDKFVKLKNVKRIVAFGGWAFSNDPGTNHIIRRGVMPANRNRFVDNLVNFVRSTGIDGVDLDWEYPGATDIRGSDPGLPEDGQNYLDTIKALKRRLSDKSVSFAAPASFWYLKNFPIKEMAAVADYIIYMTYDLHGQWDVGNQYAVEGCPNGNCLRSHVNMTETLYSLAMVTKAGVPANKIMVGVTSYGRSFKMADPKCKGPMCTFLGDKESSPAMPGECTGEGGYLADAEIRRTQFAAEWWGGEGYEAYYDKDSDSDIVIYNGDEWVAFMDHETKKRRIETYRKLGFLGTTDWAIDLQQDFNADDLYSGDKEQINDVVVDFGPRPECVLGKNYKDLQAIANDAEGKDPMCLAAKTVEVLGEMMNNAFDGYDEAAKGYDGLFPTYEKYMLDTLNSRLEQWLFDKDERKAGWPHYRCFYDEGISSAKRSDAREYKCNEPPSKYAQDYTFWFEIRNKKDWEDSLSNAGFDPEWVEGKTKEETLGRELCSDPMGNCITTTKRWIGFPHRKSGITIPDPKDVVDAARKNFTNVRNEFGIIYSELATGMFDGDPLDAVDVLSIPVSMLRDAIDSMNEVKELAKKVKEENKKLLILTILEGILFLIPFVGGLVGGLGKVGAQIARVVIVAEIAGHGALGIYKAVEDPDMAPVAILGMVMGAFGAGGISSGAKYRPLGKAKRDMSPDMKASMGKSFQDINPKIEAITSKMAQMCRRR
ncbi:hypothetical protein QBC34DRAFT_463610 [Podospora aff. communis PSN243]|uniref:chitinase n=1 Tax=Podospora aff. communis PSN243 TaxID=3040156 RepID=A0AAV9GQS8_9PEZI|nr:hypothetical protein QBC34DRAFT_463610 [Podospora aff. communis PSN243]